MGRRVRNCGAALLVILAGSLLVPTSSRAVPQVFLAGDVPLIGNTTRPAQPLPVLLVHGHRSDDETSTDHYKTTWQNDRGALKSFAAALTHTWGRFSDPRIDDLFARQTRALDPSERKRLVNEIERIVLENAYYIPDLWWARTVVHWAKVKNYVAPPNHYSNQKLQDVWLSED
jgi:ABC-type transport system substrate-binding protein